MEDTTLKGNRFTVLKNDEPIKSEELLEAFVAIGSRLFKHVHVEPKDDGGVSFVIFSEDEGPMEEFLQGQEDEDPEEEFEDDE